MVSAKKTQFQNSMKNALNYLLEKCFDMLEHWHELILIFLLSKYNYEDKRNTKRIFDFHRLHWEKFLLE